MPDDAGRGAALLAREGDVWHLARQGAAQVDSADDAGRLMASLDDAGRPTDLFLDPSTGLSDAARLPIGARFTDATGAPRGFQLAPDSAGRVRAWPRPGAGEVVETALDAVDLASMGWDVAQVSLDLGVNDAPGPTDPRGLKFGRVAAPCGDVESALPVPWRVDTPSLLTATLAEVAPSRVLVFLDASAPPLQPLLDAWTEAGHTVLTLRLPTTCDPASLSTLVDTARRDAYAGDRLPLVMLAPLSSSSILSEDPLRFCGETVLGPGTRLELCWGVPTELPEPAEDTPEDDLWEDDSTEPPLWIYGLGVLLSIPVIIVMKRRGMLDSS